MSAASESVSELPSSVAPSRRKNYSEEDDVALLRQVLLERSFAKPRGKVMQGWDSLAASLVSSPAFSRSKLSGKNAQSRMNQLVQTHRERMKEAALLSGVSEEVTEKDQLLDELVQLLDDATLMQEFKKKEEQNKRERDEEASLVAVRYDWALDGRVIERRNCNNRGFTASSVIEKGTQQDNLVRRHLACSGVSGTPL